MTLVLMIESLLLMGGLRMDNNDILIRLRYALDIKNKDMVEIFKLGGIEVTNDELLKILTKSKDEYNDEVDVEETDDQIKCNNKMLESFLNGFITFKRGKQDSKPGQPTNPEPPEKNKDHMNNMLLKEIESSTTINNGRYTGYS